MQDFLAQPLVFVDVETTGSVSNGRITEVACIRVENQEVVDEFTQLVNPSQFIPYHIQELTGIANEMVANKPQFADVVDNILRITRGAVFVAHNVWFDFNFLRKEMNRLGVTFKRNLLCTVQLSQRLFPDQSSHSLDTVISKHDIDCSNRHRAYADARAIAVFVSKLHQQFANRKLGGIYESIMVEQ